MSAYKFRVLLDSEQETEIFRDILISRTENFESLYKAIIAAFRFQGDQMASFYMSNENWDKGHEISLMDMSYGDELPEEKASLMSTSSISDYIKDPDQKMILVYDFMRMWIFLIELIDIVHEEISAPQVALSVGMAPPEDSKMVSFDEEDGLDEFNEDEFDDEEDPYGTDFEDGYDEEDYRSYDDY